MNPAWALLRLSSPQLPIGGYSYSQGLEWAVDSGLVNDATSAQQWLSDQLLLNLSRSPTSPHLAKIERPKSGPQSLRQLPGTHLKQVPKARSRTSRKASRPQTHSVLPGQNAGSSPGCNASNAKSGRPSGAKAPAQASASGGAA